MVPESELQLKLIEVGAKDWRFTDHKQLDTYLEETQFSGTRIILVPQRFSWDRLAISEHALRRLISYFKIFPAFLEVLCAFGRRSQRSSNSLGGCYSWQNGSVSETSYLLKMIEQHGRVELEEPWSIRQLGVYHQHDADSGNDTFILLNPMGSFQERLRDVKLSLERHLSPRDIHHLALSHSVWQWRWYLTFWEEQLERLIAKAHVSQVRDRAKTEKMPVLAIEHSDFQDVQVINDRMNAAKYIVGSNVDICSKMKAKLLNDQGTDLFLDEFRLQSRRVESLLERAKSGSSLMQDIISFRGLDSLRTSSENSNEMARLADIDSKNMVKLTTKSQRDASTLKKVTWLTSVYLPASFVSQFLSMGYLTVNSKASPVSLNFAAEMWIFVVLTFLFLAVTFGAWVLLDRPRKILWWRKQRVIDLEKARVANIED